MALNSATVQRGLRTDGTDLLTGGGAPLLQKGPGLPERTPRTRGRRQNNQSGISTGRQQPTKAHNQKKLATGEKRPPKAGAVSQPTRKRQQDCFIAIEMHKMKTCQWNFFLQELSELSI